ncbi:hypothetical protein GQ457_16G010650 [Hibiscus cannabinus]
MDIQANSDSSGGREGNSDAVVSNVEVVAARVDAPSSLSEEAGGGSKVPVVLINESQDGCMEQIQVLPKVLLSAKGTHTTIVIRDKENKDPDGSVMGRKSGGPIRTTKTTPKRGIALRKHGPSKGGLTSVLSEWIPAAMANIDKVAQGVVQHKGESSLVLGAEVGSDNSAQAGRLEDSVDVDNPIYNGAAVKFWTDEWLGDIGPLANHVVSMEWLRTKEFMVCDMVTLDADDFPVWRPNRNLQFTVRTAYEFKISHVTDSVHPIWRVIAAFRGWSKVRIFMWLACHERLLMNMERRRRHMTSDSSCTVCGAVSETVDHVLRQCPLAKAVWTSVVKPDRILEFLSLDLQSWFAANLSQPDYFGCVESDWDILFTALVWSIWLRRNKLIFESAPVVCESVLLIGNRMVEELRTAVTAGRLPVRSSNAVHRAGVRWEAPPPSWCKVNVDGACDSATGRASCGGAIRSDSGQWLMGFSRQLGLCSSLEAELWGIFEGLMCAWSIRIANLILESDCKEALHMIDRARYSNRRSSLVEHILRLLNRD